MLGRSREEDFRSLITLAKDLELYEREDVQSILASFEDYVQSQRRLMKIYDTVYLS